MSRILVADDNSNIQRAVALALKDAGVEVVAVGNGEAAVRKIAEIKPALVLADIFMPVRSGYEVCEFVKQDPRFAGVPVVLLIGAFDPFDEREAQRVQADAILKKPFVPADSLVRTVTDLLAQSAVRLSPAAAAVVKADPPSTPPPAPPAQEFMDEPVEALEAPKPRLEWNSKDQPIAFGTLLETPANETNADDSVVTAQRDPSLGEPAFWAPAPQAEGEPGESDSDESEASGFGDQEQWRSGGVLDEFSPQPEAVSEIVQPAPPSQIHDDELELPAEAPSKPLHASTESLPQLPELELPQEEDLKPAPGIHTFPVRTPLKAEAPQPAPEDESEVLPDLKDFAWAAPNYSAEPTEVVREQKPNEEEEIDSILDEEEPSEPEAPALATLAPFLASLTSAASGHQTDVPPDPLELQVARELSEDFHGGPAEMEPDELLDAPVASQLDPAVIEAIAQRVIERMQPKIIELVTRELLRPAVEALVQRELEKK